MKTIPDRGEQSYVGFGRMKGRKALITGGDSGIGRAAAIAFARVGADVVISCLHPKSADAKSTLALIKAEGVKDALIGADNSKEKQSHGLVAKTVGRHGGLDILVNNAGKQDTQEKIEDITTERLVQTFAVNVFGTFWITKAALAPMKPGATIINVTSVHVFGGQGEPSARTTLAVILATSEE